MGDTQSAQREGKQDAVPGEERVEVDDAQKEDAVEDKILQNKEQTSEPHEKPDEPPEVNGHCEDKVDAEVCEISSAIAPSKEDIQETAEPLKEEETTLENVDINDKESPDSDEATPSPMSEAEAKMNEINEGFKKFFSNIGLKLTVKKSSDKKADVASDAPTGTEDGAPSSPHDKDTTKETASDDAENSTEMNTAQETPGHDSTTCPTVTDMATDEIVEISEENTADLVEASKENTLDAVLEAPTSTSVANDGTTSGKEQEEQDEVISAASPGEEEVMSPIKKFFTTGIFSGLRKKKKETETKDETTEKELVDMKKDESETKAEETEQDQDQKAMLTGSTETSAVEGKQEEIKEEIILTTPEMVVTTDAPEIANEEEPSTAVLNEVEILSSQERAKVQGSPLRRLLSGSSLKRLSKKQRSRKSSDPKLSDSESASDNLLSSTESAEGQSPALSPEEATAQEDGTWTSFKKLVTPKKRPKRSSQSDEEAVVSNVPDEGKPSDGEQLSDLSTDETKKKIDLSVSWEALLCRSGKKRSRKTSDSDEETPGEPKHPAESPLESSQEGEERITSSPERTGSPSEGDGGSTWKSLKRLVTPKRKVKGEEENKDHVSSDNESNKDESSFSIKSLLPGRKKRKSTDRQDQTSSDEADRGVVSDEEDSETPAVVPLSEFDIIETDDHIQTQAVIETDIAKVEVNSQPQQDQVSSEVTETVLPDESLIAEAEKVQDILQSHPPSEAPTSKGEAEDITEFISKHQQLSDIPEEGIVEESMTTPASIPGEATRDDTIADDLIELTSEAVTAPEPVDATVADETTEMISAVSQLTESSNTSGNATPVPADYEFIETEELLQHVSETISEIPNVSLVADDVCLERINGSVSPQTIQTTVLQEAAMLEESEQPDTAVECTDLDSKDLDATQEPSATTKVESVSDDSEAISSELVSEDTTQEFNTAALTIDDVQQVDISQSVETATELEESQPLAESVGGLNENEAVSTELLLEDDELDKVDQSGDAEIIDVAQTDQAEEEEDDKFTDVDNDDIPHTQVEDEDHITEVVKELQALTDFQEAALSSEEAGSLALETQVISEDTSALEADHTIAPITDEPMQIDPTELREEGEKEDELPTVEGEFENEPALVSEEIPSDINYVMAEEAIDLQPYTAVDDILSDVEEDGVEALEKQEILEDVPMPDTDTACTATTDEYIPEVNLSEADADIAVVLATDENMEKVLHTEVDSDTSLVPVIDEIIEEVVAETSQALEEDQTTEQNDVPQQVIDEDKIDVIENKLHELTTMPVAAEILEENTSQTDPSMEEKEDQVIENDTEKVTEYDQVIDEGTTEALQELNVLTPVHVGVIKSETGMAQVLEKQVVFQDTSEPDTDTALSSVTEKPMQEAYTTEINTEEEKETEFPAVETDAEKVEPALVTQVVISDVNPVIDSVSDVVVEASDTAVEASDISEPLLPLMATEQEIPETTESANPLTPVLNSDMIETAEEGSSDVIQLAPSVTEEDHTIQVQVVDIDEKTAETIVQTIHEVRVTDATVQDVCDNVDNEIEITSATLETEEDIVEASRVISQELTQLEMENSPEVLQESSIPDVVQESSIPEVLQECSIPEVLQESSIPEVLEESSIPEVSQESSVAESFVMSEPVIIEQAVITQSSETAEGEIAKVPDENRQIPCEKQPEESADIPVEPAITSVHKGSENLTSMAHVPESLTDVGIQKDKEHIEVAKDELRKAAEVKEISVRPSETIISEKEVMAEQRTPATSCEVARPCNTQLLPQNTGLISSVGNVVSPSNISLEFKVNIQFGQTTVAASSLPVIERIETVKQADVPKAGAQVEEKAQPVKQEEIKQRAEIPKQPELSEVGVQAIETVESWTMPEEIERTDAQQLPEVSEIGVQTAEITEPVKQIEGASQSVESPKQLPPSEMCITPKESVEPVRETFGTDRVETTNQPKPNETCVQATKIIEPVIELETPVILHQPVVAEVCIQEIEAVELTTQTEEENDPDVWQDAEEDVYIGEGIGKSWIKAVESVESQKENYQPKKEILHHELGHHSHTQGEKEGQDATQYAVVRSDVDSEGEDFAVALEPPAPQTAVETTVTPFEWD